MNKNLILGIVVLLFVVGGAYYLGLFPGISPRIQEGEENIQGTTTKPTTPTQGKPTTSSTPAKTTTAPTYTPSKSTGRVVFTITDAAVGLDTLQSLVATVNELSVSGPNGWVTISKTPRAYDLLDLYKTGKDQLIADVNLAPGTYNQLRLSLGNVIVVQKEGLKSVTAKVPSNELRMNIKLVVEKEGTSSVSLDILSDKALHQASDGTYLFFPVIKIIAQHKINKVQTIGGNVELFNGISDFDQSFGIDQNGLLKNNFSIPAGTKIELLGKTIRLIPSDERSNETRTSAESAIDVAIKGGYITQALSVQTTVRNSDRVWHITGMKGQTLVNVYSSITTGAVVAAE